MQFSKYLKREWQEIRADFKYDLYKWLALTVGASMLALLTWLLRKVPRLPEWGPPGILFLVALFAFVFLASRLSAPSPAVATHPPAFPSQPTDTKNPNLRAEILDVLFFLRRHSLSDEVFVLLNIRVVNHGDENLVVTDWEFRAEVGDSTITSMETAIESNWQIRRVPPNKPVKMEVIDKDASTFLKPLSKGVPKERWICFELLTVPNKILPPHNAKFVLTLTDAFGQTHVSEWGPYFTLDTGEIVVV
jgi:hypothetical protein